MIIGFSARKQGGKTTAVNDLQHLLREMNLRFGVANFADTLKIIVGRTMIPAELMDAGTDPIAFIENSKQMMLPCGKTVREVLQLIGTDWFRTLWPDVWVNAWKQRCDRIGITLVTDIRFPNEVKAVQDAGGKVIRLLRNPYPEDTHESECALDGFGIRKHSIVVTDDPALQYPVGGFDDMDGGFDALVDNRQMTIPEQNKAVRDIILPWLTPDKNN